MRDPFRFVFLADTQLGCYATFTGFDDAKIDAYAQMGMKVPPLPPATGYEWDANRYRAAVDVVNGLRPAFVAIGGDMVDDPNSEDQIDEFLRITATIDDDITVRLVPGNHDVAPDFTTPTIESIAAYRQVFGPDRYVFDHAGTRFVVVNTPLIDHPESAPEEAEEQMGFLAEALSSGADETVLLGHHPLFLGAANEEDTYWNLPSDSRRILLDLIHANGIRFGFSGHWHRNAIATDGPYTQVVSGPVGFPLGDDPSGYRVVDVTDGGIDHEYHPLSHP